MARSERSSLVMMVCTFISRFLGIFKARAISTVFGAGYITDAINFSYNLPNNARKLFAEGAFTTAYLPAFARCSEDVERSQRLSSIIITFQLSIFLPLILLISLYSEKITRVLSSFSSEEQIQIAARLLPFFTLFLVFISLSSIFASLLQARARFLAASASPIAFTLAVIISVFSLGPGLGYMAMAIGAVTGSLMQLLVCYVAIRRRGLRFRLDFHFRDQDFLKVLSDFAPATINSMILVVSQQITLFIASGLAVGSISAYSNSIIFYQTPYGIFFASIAGVYFPAFANARSREEKQKSLLEAFSYLFTFLLPSALLLLVFGRECIAVLLQSGQFTYENTLLTYSVLIFYLIAMIPQSFTGILQRFLQAEGRYWTTVSVSLLSTIIDILATLFFIKSGDGPEALSKALVVSSSASLAIYLVLVHFRYLYRLVLSLLKLSLLNLPLLVYLLLYMKFQNGWWRSGSSFRNLFYLAAFASPACLIVLVTYIVFRVPFLAALIGRR